MSFLPHFTSSPLCAPTGVCCGASVDLCSVCWMWCGWPVCDVGFYHQLLSLVSILHTLLQPHHYCDV